MLQPVEPVTIKFISDGSSTAFTADLSLLPTELDFRGLSPTGILQPAVTNTQGVAVPTFTAVLQGNLVTFTFNTPPLEFDINTVIVIYTASFLVAL